jgi:hypothetical protein
MHIVTKPEHSKKRVTLDMTILFHECTELGLTISGSGTTALVLITRLDPLAIKPLPGVGISHNHCMHDPAFKVLAKL